MQNNEKLMKYIRFAVWIISIGLVLLFFFNYFSQMTGFKAPSQQDDIENIEEQLNGISESAGECEPNETKLEMFYSGFYHNGQWYSPHEAAYKFIDDLEGFEEIPLPKEVDEYDVNSKGCIATNKLEEGSFYKFPLGSYILENEEHECYLCDTSGICLEMVPFDGEEKILKIAVLEDVLKDVNKILLSEHELTEVTEIQPDTYISVGTSDSVAFVESKSNLGKYYVYRCVPVFDSGYVVFYDDIVGKAFKVKLPELESIFKENQSQNQND